MDSSKCNHQNEGAGKFCANCGGADKQKVVVVAMGIFSKIASVKDGFEKIEKIMTSKDGLGNLFLSTEGMIKKLNELYDNKEYSRIIEIVESNEKYKENEKIIN